MRNWLTSRSRRLYQKAMIFYGKRATPFCRTRLIDLRIKIKRLPQRTRIFYRRSVRPKLEHAWRVVYQKATQARQKMFSYAWSHKLKASVIIFFFLFVLAGLHLFNAGGYGSRIDWSYWPWLIPLGVITLAILLTSGIAKRRLPSSPKLNFGRVFKTVGMIILITLVVSVGLVFTGLISLGGNNNRSPSTVSANNEEDGVTVPVKVELPTQWERMPDVIVEPGGKVSIPTPTGKRFFFDPQAQLVRVKGKETFLSAPATRGDYLNVGIPIPTEKVFQTPDMVIPTTPLGTVWGKVTYLNTSSEPVTIFVFHEKKW